VRSVLERGIEHHELICQVHGTWSAVDEGRFYFRKDFSKYELFRNPTVRILVARVSLTAGMFLTFF